MGCADTLSVTVLEMIHHTLAVSAGVRHALLVADGNTIAETLTRTPDGMSRLP